MSVIVAGQPIKLTIEPRDETEALLEADAKPSSLTVTVNGSSVTGAGAFADWSNGYYVSWTPTTAFEEGQVVNVQTSLSFSGIPRLFSEAFTVVANTKFTGLL